MIVELVEDNEDKFTPRRFSDIQVNKSIENYKYLNEYKNWVSTH